MGDIHRLFTWWLNPKQWKISSTESMLGRRVEVEAMTPRITRVEEEKEVLEKSEY